MPVKTDAWKYACKLVVSGTPLKRALNGEEGICEMRPYQSVTPLIDIAPETVFGMSTMPRSAM